MTATPTPADQSVMAALEAVRQAAIAVRAAQDQWTHQEALTDLDAALALADTVDPMPPAEVIDDALLRLRRHTITATWDAEDGLF